MGQIGLFGNYKIEIFDNYKSFEVRIGINIFKFLQRITIVCHLGPYKFVHINYFMIINNYLKLFNWL